MDGERLTASESDSEIERECFRARVFQRLRESASEIESAWETERVFERLRETVWVVEFEISTWHFCPAKICKNPLTRVSKTRVLLESRVLETRDAIIINSFKTGQLTILLDTHCYLARGFLSVIRELWSPRNTLMQINYTYSRRLFSFINNNSNKVESSPILKTSLFTYY